MRRVSLKRVIVGAGILIVLGGALFYFAHKTSPVQAPVSAELSSASPVHTVVGRTVERGAEIAVVESVKAASEIYAPLSGEVVEINDALADEPGMVNESPEEDGWFFKMRLNDPSEVAELMDAKRSPERGANVAGAWARLAMSDVRGRVAGDDTGWMKRFDDEARNQYRKLGRNLVGLAVKFIDEETDSDSVVSGRLRRVSFVSDANGDTSHCRAR